MKRPEISFLIALIFLLFCFGDGSADSYYSSYINSDLATDGVSQPPPEEQNTDTGENAQDDQKKKKPTWLEKAEIAADSLLDQRGRLVLESKIAFYHFELLQQMIDDVIKTEDQELIEEYFKLEKRFLDITRRVETAQLFTFSTEDWKNLVESYESEKDLVVDDIDLLTDSLVVAYDPMLKLGRSKALLRKIEQKDKFIQDYTYRIGVLFINFAELKYRRESEGYDNSLDSIAVLPDSIRLIAESEIPAPPEKDYSLAKEKFEYILDKYPGSAYEDDSHYNLAFILTQSNDEILYARGYGKFHDFTRRFPESPYIPNVEMRLGQYYIERPEPDFDRAILHLTNVLEYPEAPEYENAMYRLGWCYYQNDQYDNAIHYLAQAIERGIPDLERGKYSHLMEESIDNLSKSFASDTSTAYLGLEPAVGYLNQNPQRLGLFGAKMLERMGDIYQNDYGTYAQAIAAYDTFLVAFPNDSAAPEIQQRLIKCFELMGDKDRVTEEKYEAFMTYNHSGTWAAAQTNPEIAQQANLQSEKNLREILNESTANSGATKESEDLQRTVDLCRTYLEYYPNTTETYRINYNLAIILTHDLKNYEEAYTENLNLTRKYSEGKYHIISANNAVECARLMMEEGEDIPHYSQLPIEIPPEVLDEIPYLGDNPLSNAEILYLISMQNYLSLYPAGGKADVYKYNAGVLYFKHEKFAASRHYLNKLISENPNSQYYEEAYKHIMEGYFLENDFVNSERMAREILAGSFSAELVSLASARVGESIYSNAKKISGAQNFISAGMEYKRVALETPKYDFADEALWESGQQFRMGAAFDSAIVSLNLLVQKFPQSEWADKALNNIAFIYMEDIEDNLSAAYSFEKLNTEYPQSEFAQTSLTNASFNFIEAGEFTNALRVNEKYLTIYPDAEDGREVQYENAQLYLKMNNLNQAIRSFEAFSQKYPDDPRNVRAGYEVGKYYLEQGNYQQAEKYFLSAVNTHRQALKRGDLGYPRYASFALSSILEKEFSDYLKIDYKPYSSVDSRRIDKVNAKAVLDSGYQEVITYRQKEAITAYYRLCQIDEDLARSELNQSLPSLSPEDLLGRRRAIIDSAVSLYVIAANSYYISMNEVKSWEAALIEQRTEVDEKLAIMINFRDEVGVLPPDSQRVYMDDLKTLEDIQESINTAQQVQKDCKRKVAEISLNNARYAGELLDRIVSIPDKGSGHQEKIFYRERVVSDAAFPAVMNILELYQNAYVTIDTINAESAYIDTVQAEMISVMNRINQEYTAILDDKALKRYKINLNAFKNRLLILDYDALTIFGAPLVYLDIAKTVIDTMIGNTAKYLELAHNDNTNAYPVQQIDWVYSKTAWELYQRYSGIIEENKANLSLYDNKFGETGEDVFLDGMDLSENIIGDVSDHRLNFLEYAISGIEKYSIKNEYADRLIRAVVVEDPFNYGHLMGISFEPQFIYSGTDWKVAKRASNSFRNPEFNDNSWGNAIVIEKSLPENAPDPSIINYIHTDSVAIDTTLQIPVDSVRIDTIFSFIVDSIDIDTMLYVFGDTVQIDTIIYRGEENNLPADSSFTRIYEDTIIDTTIRVFEYTYVDSAIYRITEWLAQDIILYHYTDSTEVPRLDLSYLYDLGAVPVWAEESSEKLYFRYKFNITGKPVFASITCSVDDNFSLYLNGQFLAEGIGRENGWLEPYSINALKLIKEGANTISIEAFDEDMTANGLWFRLEYNVLPEDFDSIPVVQDED